MDIWETKLIVEKSKKSEMSPAEQDEFMSKRWVSVEDVKAGIKRLRESVQSTKQSISKDIDDFENTL